MRKNKENVVKEHKETIKDKVRYFIDEAGDIFKKAIIFPIVGYILFSLASHNGCLDSARTVRARQLHNVNNLTKVVVNVEEKWKDNSAFSFVGSAMGGAGYNPRVIRRITFEDGTQTTLDYRVLAHQPFIRWKEGKEFNPQIGERYEVTKNNQLVMKRE